MSFHVITRNVFYTFLFITTETLITTETETTTDRTDITETETTTETVITTETETTTDITDITETETTAEAVITIETETTTDRTKTETTTDTIEEIETLSNDIICPSEDEIQCNTGYYLQISSLWYCKHEVGCEKVDSVSLGYYVNAKNDSSYIKCYLDLEGEILCDIYEIELKCNKPGIIYESEKNKNNFSLCLDGINGIEIASNTNTQYMVKYKESLLDVEALTVDGYYIVMEIDDERNIKIVKG